jgi:Domain of unknown function (DUF1844)
MAEEKEESSSFRVVDKRGFSADGTRREGDREPEEERQVREPAPPPRPPAAAPAEPEAEEDFKAGGGGFETLVSYLSTTAMFQMGLLAGPGGERIPPDLVNAHMTIGLLEVLQEKTQGNLTAEEAKLLDDILYELRMSYVEMEKRVSPRAK